jgi:hypothetical protein
MIDTMAINLHEPFFSIIEPQYFEGIPTRKSGVIRLVQNPSIQDIKNGIYKPYLTLYHRKSKTGVIRKTLVIEFSAPKLLFGNNFDELDDSQLNQLLDKLTSGLLSMGVKTNPGFLSLASLSKVHFSKNIPLTNYTLPSFYINLLSKGSFPKTFDLHTKDFTNGTLFKIHCNSHEFAAYDKKADLYQAKKSESKSFADKNSHKEEGSSNPNAVQNPRLFHPTNAGEAGALMAWEKLEPDNPLALETTYLKAYRDGLPAGYFFVFVSEIKQDKTIINRGAIFLLK